MKKYNVEVTEIFKYNIGMEASSKEEAIEKVKEIYNDIDKLQDEYNAVFDGSATHHEKTTFKVVNNSLSPRYRLIKEE